VYERDTDGAAEEGRAATQGAQKDEKTLDTGGRPCYTSLCKGNPAH